LPATLFALDIRKTHRPESDANARTGDTGRSGEIRKFQQAREFSKNSPGIVIAFGDGRCNRRKPLTSRE
jgi:hypothetical protein